LRPKSQSDNTTNDNSWTHSFIVSNDSMMMNNHIPSIHQSKQTPEKVPKNLPSNPNSSITYTNSAIKGGNPIMTQPAAGSKGQEIKGKNEKPLYQTPYLVHETMNAYSTQFFMDNTATPGTHVNSQDEEVLGLISNIPSFGFSMPIGGRFNMIILFIHSLFFFLSFRRNN
jgi:hypothetical protein